MRTPISRSTKNADQVDDVGFRAELAEMEDALLGNDGADQKRDHGDDRDSLPSHLMKVVHQGLQPKRTRPSQDAETGRSQGAQHLQKNRHVFRRTEGGAADGFQPRQDGILNRSAYRFAAIDQPNVIDQTCIAVVRTGNRRGVAGLQYTPGHLFKQPRAERVELAHVRHVNS